jgi:hypothetical protein
LLFLGQVQDEELFNLQLFLGLSGLSHGLTGCSCHLFTDSGEELDFLLPLVFFFLKLLHLLLVLFDITRELKNLGLHVLVLKGLFDELSKKELLCLLKNNLVSA